MSTIYGYIRVSTREQHEDRQLIALQELNIPLAKRDVTKISIKIRDSVPTAYRPA